MPETLALFLLHDDHPSLTHPVERAQVWVEFCSATDG